MKEFIRIGEKLETISMNGLSIEDFCIVIPSGGSFLGPSGAPAYVQKAASAMQAYLAKATGISVPIFMDSYPLRTKGKILIGDCFRDGVEEINFDHDEYAIRLQGHVLSINGGKRGVLYGVYTFLEKRIGFRFFSKDVERLLWNETLDVKDFEERFNPPFEYRELCDWCAWDPDWSVKNKINGNFVRVLRPEDGYGVGFAGGFKGLVHTFGLLLPADRYYKDQPDLFAFDGKRRNAGGLCLSNEKTLATVTQNAIEWLDAEEDPSLLSISINDGGMTYCRCPECQAKLDRGYNDTDIILEFVNKASRKIHEKYPGVNVETLAYAATLTPPNVVKPDEDVIIRFCPSAARKMPIEELVESYPDSKDRRIEVTKRTDEIIRTWSSLTKKMYIWDYPYNYHFTNIVYPIWRSLRPNMRYFLDHHAKGMYINGCSISADFNELKAYLLAKLMFDPTMGEDEYETHIDEFLQGFYGAGWESIKAFLSLAEECSNPYLSTCCSCYDIIPEENAEVFIREGRALFEKALGLAKDAGERSRIEKNAITVDFYDVETNLEKAYRNHDEATQKEYAAKYEKLYHSVTRHGITRITENIFFPVVTNFLQPISETTFWELKGKAYQDRNNENYRRKMYILVETDGKLGEAVEKEVLCRSNNENPNCVINTFLGGAFSSRDIHPTWDKYHDYQPIVLKGTVTDVYEISKRCGYPLNGLFLRFIPRHGKGIMVEMDDIDAGAYITFKERDPQ